MLLIRNVAIANLFGACLFALPVVAVAVLDATTRGTLEYKSQGPAMIGWEDTIMAKTTDIETLRKHAKGLVETYNIFQQTSALRGQYESFLWQRLGAVTLIAAVVLLANSVLLFWFLRRTGKPAAGS